MKKLGIAAALAVLSVLAVASFAFATGGDGGGGSFHAKMNGYNEVPSISTAGRGNFQALVRFEDDQIRYKLTYSGLEGGNVLFAHIHLAQEHVNGAVVAFLCGGGTKGACPASGTVTGTIGAGDVVAVPAQGIAAGEISEVVRAMRRGAIYANVHTDTYRGGEVRGQVERGHKAKRGPEDDDRYEERGEGRRK
ncbi:MAG: CHRD domain-containing protein [Actinobacteria bacterium]|nr:CHRD domain-containing protein [Actinomycetota bacterium]